MAKRTDDSIVLWPDYFDRDLKRSQGRRVPVTKAVPSPKAQELFTACKKLGLYPEIEEKKVHPAGWTEEKGRVKVARSGKKTAIIKSVSEQLKKARA